jgi:hypothetical protein
MKYWVSLATHGPRIDAGLRDTIETVLRFEPEPGRILIHVAGEEDRRAAENLLSPYSRTSYLRVIDTACRGSGKKIWPAMRMREAEGPDVAILTVDDDCYYQPDLPTVLMRGAEEYPDAVIAMTVWTLDRARWEPEKGLHYEMGLNTYGPGDGPNGCAGVYYPPGLPLDWRRMRRWSCDPRTEFSDDVFIAGECRRAGVRVVAVGGMYRLGTNPLAGPHGSDQTALYLSDELRHRGLLAFCLCGLMPLPDLLRGTECDPDAPYGREPVFAD